MYDVVEVGGGCFPRVHPNVDIVHGDERFRVDVREGLPFEAGTVGKIISSDFLEHLTLPEVVAFLKECWRVLVPDGTIEFVVPDMEAGVRANPQYSFHMEYMLYGTRRDEYDVHRMWYTADLARYLFQHEGWSQVRVGPSSHGKDTQQPKLLIEAWKR